MLTLLSKIRYQPIPQLTLCKLHFRIVIKTWQFSLTQSNKTVSWIRLLCKKPWKIPKKKKKLIINNNFCHPQLFAVYSILNLKGESTTLKYERTLNIKWDGMDGHPNYTNSHWSKCKNSLRVEVINKMTIGDIIPRWINNETMKSHETCVH